MCRLCKDGLDLHRQSLDNLHHEVDSCSKVRTPSLNCYVCVVLAAVLVSAVYENFWFMSLLFLSVTAEFLQLLEQDE